LFWVNVPGSRIGGKIKMIMFFILKQLEVDEPGYWLYAVAFEFIILDSFLLGFIYTAVSSIIRGSL